MIEDPQVETTAQSHEYGSHKCVLLVKLPHFAASTSQSTPFPPEDPFCSFSQLFLT
jgi:hypothetical protein